MFDVWYTGSTRFFTGSFQPKSFEGSEISIRPSYYLNITNLKQKYRGNNFNSFDYTWGRIFNRFGLGCNKVERKGR